MMGNQKDEDSEGFRPQELTLIELVSLMSLLIS